MPFSNNSACFDRGDRRPARAWRRCHQRRLAESLPRIAEITEEILGKFVASSRRAPFGIAGLAKTALLG